MIKTTQATAFKDEFKVLSKTKKAQGRRPRNVTSLQKLDPFLDKDGVIRVGGRVRRADLNDEAKFPIILPRDSHITKLLVQHFYEACLHQGRTATLNEIRSHGYWIIGGTSSVSPHILSCVRCRKLP